MACFNSSKQIVDVLSSPLGELIASVGESVSEAQQSLDAQAVEQFKSIYNGDDDHALLELRKLGYQPTWYQIPEASAEIAIALTATGSKNEFGKNGSKKKKYQVYGSPLNASYHNKFNYALKASSQLKFRIVPVPPPASASNMMLAPNIIGITVGEAKVVLDNLGVAYTHEEGIEDNELVKGQTPKAGEVISAGAAIDIIVEGTS